MTSPSIAISKPGAAAKSPLVVDAAVILFGRDDGGKPHAAWFSADDEALARKAAELMGLHALQAAAEPVRGLAARLPKGRVFASGRAFTPFVKADTYFALAEAAGVPAGDATPKPKIKSAEGGGEALPPEVTPDLPKDWDCIKVGSLALASEGIGHGWYEVIVKEQRGDGLFVVAWRDSPDLAPFPRRREHLGLVHPDHANA